MIDRNTKEGHGKYEHEFDVREDAYERARKSPLTQDGIKVMMKALSTIRQSHSIAERAVAKEHIVALAPRLINRVDLAEARISDLVEECNKLKAELTQAKKRALEYRGKLRWKRKLLKEAEGFFDKQNGAQQ